MTKSRFFVGGILLALTLCAGCASDRNGKDPVIIRAGDREVRLSTLESMALENKGPGYWDRVGSEGRREFADLIAKKEVLVLHAMDDAGGKLNERAMNIWNRWYEKRLIWLASERRRTALRVPDAILDSIAIEMGKERYLVQIVCTYEEDARDIYNRIEAGGDFDEIGSEYASRRPEHIHHVKVGWVQQPAIAGPIAKALFSLEAPGVAGVPIETKRFGWHIVRYDSSRTTSYTAQDSLVRRRAQEWYNRRSQDRLQAEMEAKYQLQYDFSHVGVLQRVFAAMHDSMRATGMSGGSVDWQALKAPVHRLTPEEYRLPLITWSGGTFTLGGFVESLNEVDLEYWPTIVDSARMADQVSGRMMRWMEYQQAKDMGVANDPEFVAVGASKRDELFFEQYEHEHAKLFAPQVSDAEVDAYWSAHADRYLSRDVVGYSFIRFPPGNEDLAWRTYEQTQRGAQFNIAATQARKTNRYVSYEGGLDPTWGPPHDDVTKVALNFEPQADGMPVVTEPQPIGDGELVILQVYFRRKPHTLDLETARPFVARDLQREMIENEVVGMLDELKEKYHLEVKYDLIP